MTTEKDEPDHRPLREIQGTDGIATERAIRDERILLRRLRSLTRDAHHDALVFESELDIVEGEGLA
jgi:hypothetical protein